LRRLPAHPRSKRGYPKIGNLRFAQPQGQESGLAQVFMQFAMHNNHKL